MTHLRFTTAQQVLDTFPQLREEVTLQPNNIDPVAYIERLLASPAPKQAITFCAYLLPRREAVRWLCEVLRSSGPVGDSQDENVLKLAENWVATPTEVSRKAAMNAGLSADQERPTTWAALAAGWSGGSMTENPDHPLPPPAHLTGLACKVAIALLLARITISQQVEKTREFVSIGMQILRPRKA